MLYSNNFEFVASGLLDIFDKKNIKNYQPDLVIKHLASIDNPKNESLHFIKKETELSLNAIQSTVRSVFIVPSDFPSFLTKNIIIRTENPRLEYMRVATLIYENYNDEFSKSGYYRLDNGSTISNSTKIAESVIIHPNVYIGPNTTFLANTVVYSNVSIIGNTTIHENCTIGPNTVIGNQGFGGEWYENNKIIMMPHLGGVIIEKNVRIGASNTIVAGTINPTKVGAFTKFDDHVHFAHNCKTGEACFITACAQFSGRVTLGDRVWIGPNCSLMQGISIGNDAVIGLGSVVTKDVPIGTKVAGNPATDIVHFVKARKIINRLIDEEGN